MSESTSADMPLALRVAAGADRFGEQRGLGISTIAYKVTTPNPDGIFILENTFLAKGGPARHLHYDQDEWFYNLEGEFKFEVGAERFHLQPGDSLLAPRQVPHVWAFVGDTRGRILVAFLPAGKMEAFFREVTRANAMPPGPGVMACPWHGVAGTSFASRVREGARRQYMADTPLIKKLGIKPKHRVLILNAPERFAEQLNAVLPEGVELVTSPTTAGNSDVVLQFVGNKADVEQNIPKSIQLVKPGGLLWISYPKQSSKVPTDINRDILWKIFPDSEWRPVTQISIDEVWSALRFRPKSEVGA